MVQRLRLFASLALMMLSFSAFAQQARVQFINNSPDLQLSKLDIYLNNVLLVDNLEYHQATPTLDVSSGQVTIVVRDAASSPSYPVLASWDVNLKANTRYVSIVTGVVNLDKFPGGNPNGLDISLEMLPIEPARDQSIDTSMVDLIFSHGAPQYEFIDLIVRGQGMLIDNILFKEVSSYYSLPPERLLFDLRHGEEENERYGSYDADLRNYKGQAIVVVWAGSRDQPPTSPYALRMVGVLPDGTLVPFSLFESPVALVQLIHNAPDPALATIDVWIGGQRIADNMNFGEATPMLYLNAERSHSIVLADKGSITPAIPIVELPIAFEEGRSYSLFVNGVLDPTDYAPNPDGREITLQFVQYDEIQLQSSDPGKTDLGFANFVTDLPRITFLDRTAGALESNRAFTEFGPYRPLEPVNTIIDVVRASDPADVLATFFVDMRTFAGRAGHVFTSGFYDPDSNKNGPDLGLFCVFPSGEVVEFPRYIPPEATFQFTHNSPDTALTMMDVYLNDELFIDDMKFRTATRFRTIPADQEVTLAFAPRNSTSAGEALYSMAFTPVNEQSYFMILQGVSDGTGYEANPNGKDHAINTYLITGMPLSGVDANKVALNFIPGAMDQKAIDVRVRSIGEIFSAAVYGERAQPTTITPASFLTDLTYSGDSSDIFGTYLTNFSSFAGQFVTLFTSGFVTPQANNNGPVFGLYGVFPDGRVFRYYEYVAPMAQMQFIHNAPDPDLLELDIYVNDELVADNMLFRSATEFLSIPAGEPVSVSIAPATSTGPGDAILSFSSVFSDRIAYLSMLHGVSDPSNFIANPDGADIAFSVDSLYDARTYASYLDEIEMNTFHGASDIPAVTLSERSGGPLIEGLGYGDHTGYATHSLISGLYDVTATTDTSIVFGSYFIDLTPYGGKSGVLFLSGFFDPEANQSGQALGLFMAFPDGNVVEFTHEDPKFALLQIIHNSADARAEAVDIYINGEKLVDDLNYLTATPYVEVPAEEEIILAIGTRDSDSPDKPLYQMAYVLLEGSVNFIMINGVTEPAFFAPNPDQISIALQTLHYPDVRLQAEDPSRADFIFVNGITDLPALDLIIKDRNPVFDGVPYNRVADYVSLDIEPYIFDLVLNSQPDSIIARFDGDIVDLQGIATLVFLSGFYSPEQNENGSALSMHAAFPNGSVVPFDKLAIEPSAIASLPAANGWNLGIAPNPAASSTLIRYAIAQRSAVQFVVYDRLGRMRLEHHAGSVAPGSYAYPLDLSTLEPGTYLVVMQTQFGVATRKVAVVR